MCNLTATHLSAWKPLASSLGHMKDGARCILFPPSQLSSWGPKPALTEVEGRAPTLIGFCGSLSLLAMEAFFVSQLQGHIKHREEPGNCLSMWGRLGWWREPQPGNWEIWWQFVVLPQAVHNLDLQSMAALLIKTWAVLLQLFNWASSHPSSMFKTAKFAFTL